MSLARLRVRAASLAFEEMCRQLSRMIELQSPDEDIRAAVRTFAQQLFKKVDLRQLFMAPTRIMIARKPGSACRRKSAH